MILRILTASLLALGLGVLIEDAHAGGSRLCDDGRIVRASPGVFDPCRAAAPKVHTKAPAAAPRAVPLPVKRPSPVARVTLKGPAAAEAARAGIGAMATAAGEYRHIPFINARPGAERWFTHTR